MPPSLVPVKKLTPNRCMLGEKKDYVIIARGLHLRTQVQIQTTLYAIRESCDAGPESPITISEVAISLNALFR